MLEYFWANVYFILVNSHDNQANFGRVVSLHLHPPVPGLEMRHADEIEVVVGKGIRRNGRFYGRTNRFTGAPSRRHVSIIAREQLSEHIAALGLESLPPGRVRSNIETVGVNLMALVGCHVAIGEAVLHFYEPRTPCAKMDALHAGLRAAMENQRQGVMAEIIKPGKIRIGDALRPISSPA